MTVNLEKTFLYSLAIVAMILLLHSGQLIFNSTTVIVTHRPRPYFGPMNRRYMKKPTTMKEDLDVDKYASEMDARVTRMREVCSQYGQAIQNHKRIFKSHILMWDTIHHLVYCPIYKVASGTWTTNFLRLVKFNEDLPKWQRFSKLYNASEGVARDRFPPPKPRNAAVAELNASTRFLVVRHPFDRILSAYKGKISRPDAKPKYYRTLQKIIKKKYSKNKQDILNKVSPTFEEYWRYLIDTTSNLESPDDWKSIDCVQSYYSRCVPCDVDYNLVLKLESHDLDTEYFIRTRNLTELSEEFVMWKHKGSGENEIGDYDYYIYDDPRQNPKAIPKDEESLRKLKQSKVHKMTPEEEKQAYKKSMFGQLTQQQMLDLHENYKVDFQMFGYDLDLFLPLASDWDNQETSAFMREN